MSDQQQQPPSPTEPTLFDDPEPTGAELRDRGIADALAADVAPQRGLRDDLEAVLDRLIASGAVFTADDLRRRLPRDVDQRVGPALVGAVFRVAANRGAIRACGWATSERPGRHRGVHRTWIGSDHADQHQEAS